MGGPKAATRGVGARTHLWQPSAVRSSTEARRSRYSGSSQERPQPQDASQYHEAGRLGALMTFLVAIHKDPDSSYGVSVPDLPGCITAGDTLDEALVMAQEAIELHLEGLLDDDREIPDP